MFRPLSLFNRARASASGEPIGADPFFRLHEEMNRLFDDAFASFGALSAAPSRDARALRIDMHESADKIVIEAELPGVCESDLDVQLADNILTISGEKRAERRDEKDGAWRVAERAYGAFSRSIALPFSADPDAISAVFKDGVLRLTLPKPPEAIAPTRRIAITKG